MKTEYGHLSYCTNIHPGEDWETHFQALKEHFPDIKQNVSPNRPMGLGLRLSNQASLTLTDEHKRREFTAWLDQQDAYVFTMNGFPYGEFHKSVVKQEVHAPDWTRRERREYTERLFHLLAAISPEGLEAGISTSPLSYRHWFTSESALQEAVEKGTNHIIDVLKTLIEIHDRSGRILHLDIEPEPDGILETGREFIDWYQQTLLPMARKRLAAEAGLTAQEAEEATRRHIQLCYDVCHFALGYEEHEQVLKELKSLGIRTGKIQISAALKALLPKDAADRVAVMSEFSRYQEPIYLHQVIARTESGEINRYTDIPEALRTGAGAQESEWRAHFHVPIFQEQLGPLMSTQQDIIKVLALQKQAPFTQHLEVETYTWGVLPAELRAPIGASIERELEWVKAQLK